MGSELYVPFVLGDLVLIIWMCGLVERWKRVENVDKGASRCFVLFCLRSVLVPPFVSLLGTAMMMMMMTLLKTESHDGGCHL